MTDVILIGAGIVSLATAYELLEINNNLKIKILEKECKPALHQSSRNSGVIHSGIYYKPNSLKAKNCIEGKEKLIQFANKYDVQIKKVGKVIIATKDKQIKLLKQLFERGKKNNVGKIELIDSNQLKEIEPYIRALKAIWLPDVQIINYFEVIKKLVTLLCRSGVEILYNHKVLKIYSHDKESIVETKKQTFKSKKVINCSGLFSDRFVEKGKKFQIIPFRGEYYELNSDKKNLINGLVYPIKDPRFPFLGVHLTKMICGKVKAGPNAILAFSREGYHRSDISIRDLIEILKFPGFWKMSAKYWKVGLYELYRSCFRRIFLRDLTEMMPCLTIEDLKKSTSGVRAQIVLKDGNMPDDFIFERNNNIIHVINAPSPAATAAFSIGKYIANLALSKLPINN
jgi:(S)-2-hydroxyglutarate dehydrogenase